MARDYIDIGSAPAEETCAALGSPNYEATARRECIRFIDQIRRMLGVEPPKASLRVKANPHDFGTYYSVGCYFDDDDEESTKYAYRCESETPSRWDTPIADSDQLAAVRTSAICSSCLETMEEETGEEESGTLEEIARMLGGDMPDHLCDAREAPDLKLDCACGCQPLRARNA